MHQEDIRELRARDFPALLREIADPPKKLYLRGTLPDESFRWLCVVGSRKFSSYGATACQKLIAELSGYPVVIVSGLALGIDSIAHEAALASKLPTIGIPGSGISDDVLYPRVHVNLARKILGTGGALLSECAPQETATIWSFPKRNRLMAGLCHATLIIEAHEKSGTLITARLAMEYNRDVLVVPGPITSPNYAGSNALLREGAIAVTCGDDILKALGITVQEKAAPTFDDLLPEEKILMEILSEPKTTDELSRETGMTPSRIHILISTLEIKKYIVARLGKIERCV
jgi:DNA processing protein